MSNIDLGIATWRKSSRSASGTTGDCVEVADLGGAVGIRDSKDAAGPVLILHTAAWASLVGRIKRETS